MSFQPEQKKGHHAKKGEGAGREGERAKFNKSIKVCNLQELVNTYLVCFALGHGKVYNFTNIYLIIFKLDFRHWVKPQGGKVQGWKVTLVSLSLYNL